MERVRPHGQRGSGCRKRWTGEALPARHRQRITSTSLLECLGATANVEAGQQARISFLNLAGQQLGGNYPTMLLTACSNLHRGRGRGQSSTRAPKDLSGEARMPHETTTSLTDTEDLTALGEVADGGMEHVGIMLAMTDGRLID